MKKFLISGFLVTGGRHDSLCYRTGFFQLKYIHSKLIIGEKKFAVEGRFLIFHFYREFYWDEVMAIRARRSYPVGHCLEFIHNDGMRLNVYCLTRDQRNGIADILPLPILSNK